MVCAGGRRGVNGMVMFGFRVFVTHVLMFLGLRG